MKVAPCGRERYRLAAKLTTQGKKDDFLSIRLSLTIKKIHTFFPIIKMSLHEYDHLATDRSFARDDSEGEMEVTVLPRYLTNHLNIEWIYKNHKQNKLNLESWYQRKSVWSELHKKDLIEAIYFRDTYVPPIVTNSKNKIFDVVDGKQRITSIIQFMDNQFKIYDKTTKKHYFFDKVPCLSEEDQETFKNRILTFAIFQDLENDDVLSIFHDLQKAVPLRPEEKLNAHDDRLTNLIRDLIQKYPIFKSAKNKSSRNPNMHCSKIMITGMFEDREHIFEVKHLQERIIYFAEILSDGDYLNIGKWFEKLYKLCKQITEKYQILLCNAEVIVLGKIISGNFSDTVIDCDTPSFLRKIVSVHKKILENKETPRVQVKSIKMIVKEWNEELGYIQKQKSTQRKRS